MKNFRDARKEDAQKGDANSNKWAAGFLISEIAILVMAIVMFFMTRNYWILGGGIAYFLFSVALFLRMLDMRKSSEAMKEKIDEHKRK